MEFQAESYVLVDEHREPGRTGILLSYLALLMYYKTVIL